MGFCSKHHSGWGQLEPIFRLAQFTFRYRLYVPIARVIPEEVIHSVGHLLAIIVGGSTTRKNLLSALLLMYKNKIPKTRIKKIVKHTLRFMGLLAFDTIFVLPNLTPPRLRKRIEIQDVKYYLEALTQKKGVIVTSIHLSKFFHGVVSMQILPEVRKVYAIANPVNIRIYSLPLQQAGVKLIPNVVFSKSKIVLQKILRENNVIIIAWDMGSRDTQLKVRFLDFLLPSPGSVVSLALDTGAPILPCVILPNGRGYKKQILKFFPPFNVIDKGSKKDTFGYYNTYLNTLFAPYFRQYPFLWEELLGLPWRTRRIFQFPNGANRVQIANLVSAYLRQLVDSSWEQGRDDKKLKAICDVLNNLSTNTDERFQSYPFRSPKKIQQITVELPRDSVLSIFRYLLNFLEVYPNIRKFLTSRDFERFKRRQLSSEEESRFTTAIKGIIAQLG